MKNVPKNASERAFQENFVNELINMSPPAEDDLFLLRGFANVFNNTIKPNLESHKLQHIDGEVFYRESGNRIFEISLIIDTDLKRVEVLKFQETKNISIPKNQVN